ncbi:MAG: FHA domain-containing protein [Myxococcales bacterium]|nr:FHA domain-containing protein [Myxococcales bacterium]
MNSRSDLYRVRSLSECLRDVLSDDDEAQPHPVLLHVMTQVEYWAKQTVRTMALADSSPVATTENRWRSPSLLVLKISPRPGSRAPEQIVVGRTARADVCLPYPRISKHHAHFREVDGALELVDNGSTNGTYIDGVRLEEGVPVALPPDCIIHFGKYETRFMAPEVFRQHLEALAGRS